MPKVLIVEDTEVNRIVLSHRLEDLGYEIVLAVDGEEAVTKAHQAMPDIILMDMCLPVMDGGEVTQLLKRSDQTKHIPIIALTAHALTKAREDTIGIGCDEYETKPVDFDRLVSKMEALIHKS
jgi:CheY-like chemotaxis protein